MKILIACSTLDLKYKMGCTPHWWQLFKGMYETGNEVIVIPYLGDSIETLWWRTYPNPCLRESRLYNSYLEKKKKKGELNEYNEKNDSFLKKFSEKHVRNKWEKHLINILEKEKNVESLLFMNVPLTHIKGIAARIRSEYSVPVAYFDGDMPIALPKYVKESNYKFHYYKGVDLSEYDAFFTNSKGVIPDLKEMGAKNVYPIYYAADPELYRPIEMKKEIDVSFFGFGSSYREDWMKNMITDPSKKLKSVNFSVGGGFDIDLGNANQIGDLSFSAFRDFCCKSKICLNITRKTHATVYASASARPFELAAYGTCMVSNPVNGIEEWFEVGKELSVIKDEKEAMEIYRYFLDNSEEREQVGNHARERVLKEHTFRHRASELVRIIRTASS